MRVLGGYLKGYKFRVPAGIRPTTARTRAALFDILREEASGCYFLDLFAGAGGVGIEALSRGATKAVFVEKNPRVALVLRENLAQLGILARAEVWTQDAGKALEGFKRRENAFSLIFLDPPYGKGYAPLVLEKVGTLSLLLPGGKVILETRRQEGVPLKAGRLERTRVHPCGDIFLYFYTEQ